VDLAQELEHVRGRFQELFDPAPAESRFLGEQVEAIAAVAAEVPLVFQHGDATTWNSVVAHDRIAFLDWEYGGADGLPLWDLLDFLQSFGAWRSTAVGSRGLSRHGRDEALHRAAASAVRDYSRRLHIDQRLIEPLFYTCWMERAVRSASAGHAARQSLPSLRLLRFVIENRHMAAVACMFE
jgi:thiamine kinase-like enzyme